MWRRLRVGTRRALGRVLGQRDSTARIARGVAAGFFASAFPLPGLQIPLSLLAAWAVRGNKVAAIFPQFISNAVTMAPLAALQYMIGAWLWPGTPVGVADAASALGTVMREWEWGSLCQSAGHLLPDLVHLGPGILGPMILGILVTGLAMAVAAYPLAVIVVFVWRMRRRSRRLRKGSPARAPRPLAIPEPREPAPPRDEIQTRYVRRPKQLSLASAATLLADGREAYPDMLAAIDAATISVDLETYILKADRTGTRFQEALVRASRRGVCVRLLYDYVGSWGLPDGFVRPLLEAGVAVSVYRPPVFGRGFLALGHRDHRKILLVDRRTFFTGGINIADENLPVEEGGGWRDTEVRLEGPAMAAAGVRLFMQAWRKASAYGETKTRAGRVKATLRRLVLPVLPAPADREAPGPPVAPDEVAVQVIGNEEYRHRRRIRRAYLFAIKQARRYVFIENAYFIPDRGVRRALARAVKRGVLVAVATAGRSDVPIASYASRGVYSELLAAGVRLFEWPEIMLHAKVAVIDDAWAIVGSYNFDRRSLFHQLEAVAMIADPGFAVRLRAQLLGDFARCHEVTLFEHESRSWRRMLLESAAYALRRWL